MAESPANTFGKAIPVFWVKDVKASVDYYTNALGFKVDWTADGFASVSRDKCNIFLTSDKQSQPRMWIWIGIEGEVRSLHAQLVAAGAKIRNPPSNFEWALEMQIEDLDGNVLRIGSDPEDDQPLGIFPDADGVRWKHLGNGKHERVD